MTIPLAVKRSKVLIKLGLEGSSPVLLRLQAVEFISRNHWTFSIFTMINM